MFPCLTESARRLVLRIGVGRLDTRRCGNTAARVELLAKNMICAKPSPKGRKCWYVLTPQGLEALPHMRKLEHASKAIARHGFIAAAELERP